MGKQEEITGWLKAEIDSGRLTTGRRVPSEYELAEQFGINKTTANKAVAALVSEGLLERGRRGTGTFVRQRNPFRGQLMFIISIEHPYCARLAHGAQRAAMNRGYLMTLSAPVPEELNEFVSRLSPSVALGILTAAYGRLPEINGVPVIHIDREFPSDVQPCYLINSDGTGGMQLAVKEFLRCGHRELVMIGYHYLTLRTKGFINALNQAGIPDAENRVFISSAAQVQTRLLDEIYTRFPNVTGIVTASDDIAYSLISCMNKKGMKVPDDISVSGFGNIRQICDLLELSSVEQHNFEMGAFAANRLIDIIEGKYQEPSFYEALPCDLVSRHSIRSI